MIAIATNGSPASIAKVQTILEAALPFDSSISQFGEFNPESAQLLSEFQSASEVIIVASLLIAGCGLAVAMAASIIERRRPFSMLRLSGTSVAVLRRVVALETALPLVVISLASAGIGLTASDLFLRSQFAITLRMPGIKYFGIIVGGLLLSLLIVASTITLLDPMTRPENARWE
jgi:predicted lysophospholipase L1 biosynthesis ABC-type transport system permease subunit